MIPLPFVVPKWVKEIFVEVIAIGLVVLAFFFWGEYKEHIGEKNANAKNESEMARMQKIYVRRALELESKYRMKTDDAIAAFVKKTEEGYAQRDKTIADLRSGNLRLRKQWQGCPSPDMPEASASAGSLDAEAELRNADAANLVRIADQCDAHVESLQAILKGEREE